MTCRIAALALAPLAAWSLDLPGAVLAPPQPLQFGVEQVQVDLRIDLAHGAAAVDRVDDRVSITAPLPVDASVLRARDIAFPPVLTDSGERLGLLLKPPLRDQVFGPDHQLNRDRLMRLTFDLTPPWKSCTRLRGLKGAVTLTLGRGKPHEATLEPKTGASAKADAFGAIEVVDAGDKGLTLRAPRALADRLASVVARDRDGKDLPPRLKETARTESAVTWGLDIKPERCATLAASWFVEVGDERVSVAIDEIEIPGGISGMSGLVEGPGLPAPALPKPATLKAPLQRAIVAGDRAEIARLLETKIDVNAVEADGRAPLARAAAAGDEATVRDLLAHHADPAAVGRDGWTALHCAVAANDVDCVRALVAGGVDPAALAKDGRSCLDLARDMGRWRILHLLLGNADGTF